MPGSTSHAVAVNGANLRVSELGTGIPVILIHGSLDGMDSFRRQVKELSRHFRVIRYARRHHPPSENLSGSREYTLDAHRDDLLGLLNALGIATAHLVGSSYGGYVALAAALQWPERVLSLVLGEPPILPFLRRSTEGSEEFERFFRTALDPAREAFGRGDSQAGVRYFVDGIRGMHGSFGLMPESSQAELMRFAPELSLELTTEPERFMPDFPCTELEPLAIPVLLLTGERSPRLFHLITAELARCLQNASQKTIPLAGHAMHVMNPHAYTREVLAFLGHTA